MDLDLVKFFIAISIVIPLLVLGMAYAQQRTIKTTCGIDVSLSDALYYDMQAASCPLVTIKNK